MVLWAVAVLAGVLTVLSPCVVTLLPGVVAPALVAGAEPPVASGRAARWAAPVVIAASLGVSVVVFTLLLKWLTTLAAVDPVVWRIGSGTLLVALGAFLLAPGWWDRVATATGWATATHRTLSTARRTPTRLRWVLTGAALGPVFSSCSPVYAFVLASVLPVDAPSGVALVAGYGIGLAGALVVVGVAGRALVGRLGWALDPHGWFRRLVATAMVITGVVVAAGWQRALEDGPGRLLPPVLASWEGRVLDAALGPAAPAVPPAPLEAVPPAGQRTAPPVRMSERPRPAPEFAGLTAVVDAAPPPVLSDLRGQVVLVDFWTFGCVNCRNTQSHLNAWHDRYAARGLRIVGVHAPEFAYERVPANVAAAVREAGIRYPVALDNDFATWNAYGVRAWPTMMFLDRRGQVRHVHVGEGDYDTSAAVIEALLGE